jgi:hypothetical protein
MYISMIHTYRGQQRTNIRNINEELDLVSDYRDFLLYE